MAGTSLVSIRDIEELKGIERKENGDIYIGAGTVFLYIIHSLRPLSDQSCFFESVDQSLRCQRIFIKCHPGRMKYCISDCRCTWNCRRFS